MAKRAQIALWVIAGIAVAAAVILLTHRRQPVTLRGSVLRQDVDVNRQLPLADVEITAINSLGSAKSRSDALGFFSLTLPKGLRRRQPVLLQFRYKNYKSLDWDDYISDKLYVARMTPIHQETIAESHIDAVVSNTRVRYSVKSTAEANIGSAARVFQAANVGNTPCNNNPPCAPGGKWKATINSQSFDAGAGNEFRNARVSCIAGPCAFTKIDIENFNQDHRHFNVSVRNWSDTTTFLFEAEVVHPMTSDLIRETYPVIFGRAMNFSLPALAEGPSIEAEISGEGIVFPLGPDLFLRWADCHMVLDRDLARNYRCELKRGYQFR